MISTRRGRTCLLALAVVLWSVAADATDGGDTRRGGEIAAGRCAICHAADGESASPPFPRLAGQHPRYIEAQLRQFERRPVTAGNAGMQVIAAKLGDSEAHAVAEFIATLD